MIDIAKDFNDELDWSEIELSPSIEAIRGYDLHEATSAKIPSLKKWSLRNEENRFKSSRMDSPYYRQSYKEKKEEENTDFINKLELLDEKQWLHKIPKSLARDFANVINSDDPDYEEARKAMKNIIEYVQKVVGEDDFYETGLLDDLEYADLESEEDVNYYIDEMYDVLDGYSFWMDPPMSFDESNHRVREASGDFDVEDFESKIPENMRCKHWDSNRDFLYWVTQEDFTNDDLAVFKRALSHTPFSQAYVICRDYSHYDCEEDIENDYGYLVALPKSQQKGVFSHYRDAFAKFLKDAELDTSGPFGDKPTVYSERGFTWNSQVADLRVAFDPSNERWTFHFEDEEDPELNDDVNGFGFNELIDCIFNHLSSLEDIQGLNRENYYLNNLKESNYLLKNKKNGKYAKAYSNKDWLGTLSWRYVKDPKKASKFSRDEAEYYAGNYDNFDDEDDGLDIVKESIGNLSARQVKEILEKLFLNTKEIFKNEILSSDLTVDIDPRLNEVSVYEVAKFKDSDWPIITSVNYDVETGDYEWESKADYPRDYDGRNGNPYWADGYGTGFGQLLEDLADEIGLKGVEEYVGLDPEYQGKYKESLVHDVLDDANVELQKAKKSNEMYDTVDVEDRISVAQGHIRKAEMMVESEGTPKITGTWKDILEGLRKDGFEVSEYYNTRPSHWLMLRKDGREYEAEVTKYFDGSYELMKYNIAILPEGR